MNLSKVFIEAASRFDIIGVKIEAEKCLVKYGDIDVDNFLDIYHFAINMSCPLLKEHLRDSSWIITCSYFNQQTKRFVIRTPVLSFELLKHSPTHISSEASYEECGRNEEKLHEMDLSITVPKARWPLV